MVAVTVIDFDAQTRLVARLADGVADGQLGLATPCPDYAVRHLLGHLVGLAAAFRAAARKDFGPMTDTSPQESLPDVGPDWRGELDKNLRELAEAWREPAAWEGFTRAGGVDLPADVAGQVAMNELVVHGWDLARATGQDYAPDEASLRVSYELLAPEAGGSGGDGEGGQDVGGEVDPDAPFGPAVPVPPGAPLLDRVIGLSGRDPRWPAR
ncbi:TIGR03086 family metal-binding protein [Streptomyces tritici]|uniref:TIGR03086 family metal-binding protein n=1 Tax=Streptomyces tritici TaxID=2054410 RepID=UPI003AF1639B